MTKMSKRRIPEKNKKRKQKHTIKDAKTSGNSNKSTNKKFFLGFGLILFFIITLFFIPKESVLSLNSLSKGFFYLLSIVLSGLLAISIFNKSEELNKNIVKYSFLVMLLFNIFVSIVFQLHKYFDTSTLIQLDILFTYVLFPMTVFGIYGVFQHKDEIALFFEKNENNYTSQKNIFSAQNGVFLLLVILSGIVLFYKLGYFDFWSDEKQVVMAGYGHHKSGEFKYWDFIKNELDDDARYGRAQPHIFILSWAYSLFDISEWSSRLVSASFGLLLIVVGYFIMNYFTRNRYISLISLFLIVLNGDFLLLFRWTRMYGMIIPIYLITFYILYRAITETNSIKLKAFNAINKYLNFHYGLLAFAIVLIILNDQIHRNVTALVLVTFIFLIYKAVTTREKKYIISVLLGVLLIIVFSFSDFTNKYLKYMTFFSGSRYVYKDILFNSPFKSWLTISLILIGGFFIYFTRNKKFQDGMVLSYLNTVVITVVFIYIVFFGVSFRYVSFAVPILIMLAITAYFYVTKLLFNKYIHSFLIVLILFTGIFHYSGIFAQTYENNRFSPAWPSKAYPELIDNYKKGEPIFAQYFNQYYINDIDTSAFLVDMSRDKRYTFEKFIDDINKYKKGWITWYTFNQAQHIDEQIAEYSNLYFKKSHGLGIDNTGVELFYFTDSLISPIEDFATEKMIPYANLNLNNELSIAFWINLNDQSAQKPFTFKSGNEDVLNISIDKKDKSLNCFFNNDSINAIKTKSLDTQKWYHFVYQQKGGLNNGKFEIYLDGQLVNKKKLNVGSDKLVKFRVNKYFPGNVDDIRAYDFNLTTEQIDEIVSNNRRNNSKVLTVDGNDFETLFHWQKR